MNKDEKQAQHSGWLDEPGRLWADLLSRDPASIMEAYASLDSSNQQAVLAHLQRMVSEPGWQPEQRLSARAALDVLSDKEE